MDMRRLLRFWFTFDEPVDRGSYVRHGAALAVLKYAVDAAVVGLTTGRLWTPLDYVNPPLRSLLSDGGAAPDLAAGASPDIIVSLLASPLVGAVLAAWTLPFLWIGVTLSMRRLIDAGWSAWWSLLFFVPFVRFILFVALALAPSGSARRYDAPSSPRTSGALSSIIAVAFGTLVGVALVMFGAMRLQSYGLTLFMGTPFVTGTATGYLKQRLHPVPARTTLTLVALTVPLLALVSILLGIEGAVCLAMAAPLGLVLAFLGGIFGRKLASVGEGAGQGALLLAILLPTGFAGEGGVERTVTLREVRTSVVIDAAPMDVWHHVIAFEPIPPPTSLPFRLGIAYPIRAEIEGSGVGAVRYCVFSTGAFVEPITAWEVGQRLAFDVIESPPPLRELSFRHPAPPHLDGYLAPRAGEFRLVDLGDGRTRLEGSTWYEQRLQPEAYWALFSDALISRIHGRVLDHIRSEAESTLAQGVARE